MTTTAPRNFREAWQRLPQPRADKVLAETAHRISREFGNIMEPADLGQEFLLFLVQKPSWVTKWFYEKPEGTVNFGWMSFKRDAASIMARAAREARASSGYGTDDEFYTPKGLEALLPFVFVDPVLATVGEKEEVRAPVDAAVGGGHLASVMDVRIAYENVVHPGGTWDSILTAIYGQGTSTADAAAALGMTPQTFSTMKRKAIDAILFALNGTVPLKADHDGPGSRQARSNASAIAETRGLQ